MAPKGKVAKTASKNNPSTRLAQKKRFFQGKEVRPIAFVGSFVGLQDFIAMEEVSTKLMLIDSNGRPYPFSLSEVQS